MNGISRDRGARTGRLGHGVARRRGGWALLALFALGGCGQPLGPVQEGAMPEEALGFVAETLAENTPILLPAQQVHRRVFTTAALNKAQPHHHILAGAAHALARDNPGMTDAQLAAGLNDVASALALYTFDPEQDTSGLQVRLILRILARAEPGMAQDSPSGRALRSWARDFLGSMSQGLDMQRALSSLLPQVDRYTHAEAFLTTTWDRLHDLAQSSPALTAALETSELGAALGFKTTDSVQNILSLVPLPQLGSFVLAHLQPDGSLATTSTEARALVTASGTQGLSAAQQYANILYALDDAEQAYHDSVSLQAAASASMAATAATNPQKEALKAAITKAKADRARLKEQLKGAAEGVDGALFLASELFEWVGAPEVAKDTLRFSKALATTLKAVQGYTDSTIKTAEKLTGLLGLGTTGFKIVSGAIFTGQVLGAAYELFSVLTAGPAQPPVEQVILTEVRKLKELITQLQGQMATRFDRVDRKLNALHQAMDSRFDLVDWNLGLLNQDVNELQEALFEIHAELNRMDHNMYAYLADLNRDRFNDGVSLYLGWDTRHSIPMAYDPHYITAEALFYTWATVDSKQELLAGAATRDYSDLGMLTELSTRPLSYNINYLSQLPLQRLGMSALSNTRLAGPMEWMAGAEAYSQLSEEQAGHVASQPATRHALVEQPGVELEVALRHIGTPLFRALKDRYTSQWTSLKTLIQNAETAWETDPNKKLYGIDLWGGPDQEPGFNFLKSSQVEVLRCNGPSWYDLNGDGSAEDLYVNISRWNHDVLRPLVIADNLNLRQGTLEVCAKGNWVWWSAEPTGFQDFVDWTFRLKGTVYVRYRYHDGSQYRSELVYSHALSSGIQAKRLLRESEVPTFNPDTVLEADKAVQKNWNTLLGLTSSDSALAASFRTSVRNEVITALQGQQRSFYTTLSNRMGQSGDALHSAAGKLTASKLLWDSYVALGLPLALEHDEELRMLLYGEDAVLAGRDLQPNDALDDLRDVYQLFGATLVPPPTNILPEVDAAVTGRVSRLKEVVDAHIDRQTNAGERQSSVWTDATRLRLRLSRNP